MSCRVVVTGTHVTWFCDQYYANIQVFLDDIGGEAEKNSYKKCCGYCKPILM
jgi:hypothetical protein